MKVTSDPIVVEAVLAFPSLFQKTKPRGSQQAEKFNTAVLITQQVYDTQIKPVIDGMITQAFTNKEAHQPTFKWGFLPCTHKPDTYPGDKTQGMYFGNPKSDYQPDIVDANRNPVMDPNLIRDGAKVYVEITMYTFSDMSKGIGLGLGPVMFVEQGEALNKASGRSAATAFEGIQPNANAPAPTAGATAAPQATAPQVPAPDAGSATPPPPPPPRS